MILKEHGVKFHAKKSANEDGIPLCWGLTQCGNLVDSSSDTIPIVGFFFARAIMKEFRKIRNAAYHYVN